VAARLSCSLRHGRLGQASQTPRNRHHPNETGPVRARTRTAPSLRGRRSSREPRRPGDPIAPTPRTVSPRAKQRSLNQIPDHQRLAADSGTMTRDRHSDREVTRQPVPTQPAVCGTPTGHNPQSTRRNHSKPLEGGPRRGLPGRSGASLRALPREGMTRPDPSRRRNHVNSNASSRAPVFLWLGSGSID
jgi:hypothetical protein